MSPPPKPSKPTSQAPSTAAPPQGVTAESLARHTQAVLQDAFVLSKAADDPALVLEAIGHLRRYLEYGPHIARYDEVNGLSTFLLLHAATSSDWCKHLVKPRLEAAGQEAEGPLACQLMTRVLD